MSTINTTGININYPVPGINNNSQGFRDNFAAIKTNVDSAGLEITDLQQKVVVKTALNGSAIDNNMNDTLISNALTKSFRATTYNLGNDLNGTITIDVSKGDVQYGAITDDVTLNFTGWAVEGLQSRVELQLTISNALAVVTFSGQVSVSDCLGATTLESFANVNGSTTVTIPYGVCQLDYRLSSLDCGTTILIEPINRPRKSTELRIRTPIPNGYPGDVPGTICAELPNATTVTTVTNTDASGNVLTCSDTSIFYLDQPVMFTGTTFGGVAAGTTYYIRTILSTSTFTLSTSPGTISGPSSSVTLSTVASTMQLEICTFMYVATGEWDSVAYTFITVSANSGDTITMVDPLTGFPTGLPVIFTGTQFAAEIVPGTIYYVASVSGTNITISRTRHNGVPGQKVVINTTTVGSMTALIYWGTPIWKRIPLQSW